jgi:signal-transduction protein with cAMP-binding, CBS, and nucleotidyltransferase domain
MLGMVNLDDVIAVYTTEGLLHLIRIAKDSAIESVKTSLLQTKNITKITKTLPTGNIYMGYNSLNKILYIVVNDQIAVLKVFISLKLISNS